MATCRDIVTRAMRFLGQLAAGENPSDSEADDGMVYLQSAYDRWVSSSMFGRLTDTYVTASRTAKEHENIYAAAGVTITLPATINDCGVARQPRDLACVAVYSTDTTTRTVSIFDQYQWVQINGLGISDTAPLSGRDAVGLAAYVATEMADEYGADLKPATVKLAAHFRAMLSAKLGTTQDRAASEYY